MAHTKWHSSKTFNDMVLKYHQEHGRRPSLTQEKEMMKLLMSEIKDQMAYEGLFTCGGYQIKGSVSEGVNVPSPPSECPEIDIDFVIDGGQYLEATMGTADGWALLRKRMHSDLPVLTLCHGDGTISPKTVKRLFLAALTRCDLSTEAHVELKDHGPAVQLNVYSSSIDELWFKIDLTPVFLVKNSLTGFQEYYIAKRHDEPSLRLMWYKSHATSERRIMMNLSENKKMVLRILKAMRESSPDLSGLESYHMKTAFFKIMDRLPNESDWSADKIGQRLIDLLHCIHSCLKVGKMTHYFNGWFNILKLDPTKRNRLKNKI